ncbi:MAG TPA: hypothetical protein PLN86_15595 [Candidatus Hydrogenedentes bacterium]|nr:hypothetical protein [Candidatus Hydrogenedentota bacterium]
MPTQLSFAFSTKSVLKHPPPPPLWLDVTQIGHGVGFTTNAEMSVGLYDALTPISTEEDGDYDQRLYDALWLARFELALNHKQSANFTFAFPRKHWRTEEITDIPLRLRCEVHDHTTRLGLLADFQEAAWRTT